LYQRGNASSRKLHVPPETSPAKRKPNDDIKESLMVDSDKNVFMLGAF
jgi:hypothetical protein